MPNPLFYVSGDATNTPPFLRFGGEFLRRVLVPRSADVPLTEGAYAFVLAVSDTRVFFDGSATDDRSDRFFLASVPNNVCHALAEGRCVLILDISNEGIYYSKALFESILRWLRFHKIEERRIMILNQNRLLRRLFARDFPGSSLGIFSYDYFVKSIACLFNVDGFDSKLVDSLKHQGLLLTGYRRAREARHSHTFLCLNATPRPHRVLFLSLLKDLGIVSSALYTFHRANGGKGAQFNSEMATQLARKLGFLEAEKAIATFNDWASAIEDRFSERGNDLAMRIDAELYEKTFASLVTETEISDGAMVRVTEKTLKPIFMEHPFLVFGNAGSLGLIREFGFLTFSPHIDESYDEVSPSGERAKSLLGAISSLRSSVEAGDLRVIEPLREISRHNAKFARECFSSAYELKYEHPIVEHLQQVLDPRG